MSAFSDAARAAARERWPGEAHVTYGPAFRAGAEWALEHLAQQPVHPAQLDLIDLLEGDPS